MERIPKIPVPIRPTLPVNISPPSVSSQHRHSPYPGYYYNSQPHHCSNVIQPNGRTINSIEKYMKENAIVPEEKSPIFAAWDKLLHGLKLIQHYSNEFLWSTLSAFSSDCVDDDNCLVSSFRSSNEHRRGGGPKKNWQIESVCADCGHVLKHSSSFDEYSKKIILPKEISFASTIPSSGWSSNKSSYCEKSLKNNENFPPLPEFDTPHDNMLTRSAYAENLANNAAKERTKVQKQSALPSFSSLSDSSNAL